MQKFKVTNPQQWERVQSDRAHLYRAPNGRTVLIDYLANGPVAVYYAEKSNMKDRLLVAVTDGGPFHLSIDMRGKGYLFYEMAEGVEVYMKGHVADQRRHRDDEASFTSLEPKGRRNSDLDRMMQYVKLNEKRRERELADGLAQLEAKLTAQGGDVVDPGDTGETTKETETTKEDKTDATPAADDTASDT